MKEPLEVQCYSGHTYAERPVSFRYRGKSYEVAEIEKAWQEPEGRYFRLRTLGDKVFILCYNQRIFQWEIREL